MVNRRTILRACSASLLAVLFGCAQLPAHVGHEVLDCCHDNYERYRSYRLMTGEMPAFLLPFAPNALEGALQTKGLTPTNAESDLLASLSFAQSRTDEPAKAPDFEGHLEPGGAISFVATLTVELTDARDGHRVWMGRISHLHYVAPGEYMHLGRAAQSMREGFDEVLAGYPVLR